MKSYLIISAVPADSKTGFEKIDVPSHHNHFQETALKKCVHRTATGFCKLGRKTCPLFLDLVNSK